METKKFIHGVSTTGKCSIVVELHIPTGRNFRKPGFQTQANRLVKIGINMQQADLVYNCAGEGVLKPPFVSLGRSRSNKRLLIPRANG
jgi:hypothetical protein